MKITIKDMPIELFDANMEYLNGGSPGKEKLDNLKNAFYYLRKEYQKEYDKRIEQNNKRPDENIRMTSANPTSVEHSTINKNKKENNDE